jgi:hypothetical protein
MANNSFTKNLNSVLKESHYPHLSNKLFDNLILPPGLIKNELNTIKCTNIKVRDTDECLDQKVFDKLVDLVEVKPDKPNNSVKKSRSKPTRNKNRVKREKKTRRKR